MIDNTIQHNYKLLSLLNPKPWSLAVEIVVVLMTP